MIGLSEKQLGGVIYGRGYLYDQYSRKLTYPLHAYLNAGFSHDKDGPVQPLH